MCVRDRQWCKSARALGAARVWLAAAAVFECVRNCNVLPSCFDVVYQPPEGQPPWGTFIIDIVIVFDSSRSTDLRCIFDESFIYFLVFQI